MCAEAPTSTVLVPAYYLRVRVLEYIAAPRTREPDPAANATFPETATTIQVPSIRVYNTSSAAIIPVEVVELAQNFQVPVLEHCAWAWAPTGIILEYCTADAP